MSSTPFWVSEPTALYTSFQLWPAADKTFTQNLNAVSRLVVILTGASYLLLRNIKIIIAGLTTLAAIVLLYYGQALRVGTMKETFQNPANLYELVRDNFTQPAVHNPVMNILLPEIADNPTRNMAAPAFNPTVLADITANAKQFIVGNLAGTGGGGDVDARLFKDLGDNFEFDRSMRQWYAMPNTTVPNNQKGFTDFLYGDMISCRDTENGELACTRSTPPRWTNY